MRHQPSLTAFWARLRPKLAAFSLSASTWTPAALLFWLILLIGAKALGFDEFMEQQLVSPLVFRLRHAAHAEPELSPRLKIFAFDIQAAVEQGEPRLAHERWPVLLQSLARAKPKAIIVQSQFALTNRKLLAPDVAAIAALRNLSVPHIATAFLAEGTREYRKSRPSSALGSWRAAPTGIDAHKLRGPWHAYGPEGAFDGAFTSLGHTVQLWQDQFAPFVATTGEVIPHVALYAADQWRMSVGQLHLDGRPAPIGKDGLLAINFLSPERIDSRIKTLLVLYNQINQGNIENSIGAGDVVLLLDSYGSGVDLLPSPFGPIPSPWLLIAILNSVMTGEWLHTPSLNVAMLALIVLCGAAFAKRSDSRLILPGAVLITGALFAVGIASFILAAWRLPLAMPALAFLGATAIVFSGRIRQEQRQALQLAMEQRTAAALQRDFLPHPTFSTPACDLAAHYQAADAVGGDWFSYTLEGDRWLLTHVSDVTGHGTPAALCASFAMGATCALERAAGMGADGEPPLAALQQQLNGIMFREGSDRLMLTMVSVAIDLVTGDVFCINSAHPSALILRANGSSTVSMAASGTPILGFSGTFPQVARHRQRLEPGDYLVLFTDGIQPIMRSLTRTGPRARAQLAELIATSASAESLRDQLIRRLADEVHRHLTSDDDVTLVVIHYRGPMTQTGVGVNPKKIAND